MNLSELQAALAKLEDLAARDKRFEDVVLQLSTALADLHEHQVQQAPLILAGFIEALKGLKVEPNVSVQVHPTIEFKPVMQLPAETHEDKPLRYIVNRDRMNRIESIDVIPMPSAEQ
jgi:hypothetical protein